MICEVRSRSRKDYGDVMETVDARKRGKLIRATLLWQARRPAYAEAPLRFDVITLDGEGKIDWLQQAFDAGD